MILLGFWRGTVEMKKARLRALTQIGTMICSFCAVGCRNEESPTEGIDTGNILVQCLFDS